MVEVVDNLLNPVNTAGFQTLQVVAPASQSVLDNAERYALFLADAMSQNGSILLSRQNIGETSNSVVTRQVASVIYNTKLSFLPASIVIRSERITVTSGTPITDVIFPEEEDLSSDVSASAVITIPAELIVERSNCKLQVTIDIRKYSFSYFPSFIYMQQGVFQ